MIIEIPSSNDFSTAGLGFINLAVDQVIELYDALERSGVEEEVAREYWRSAQQPLASALALVQQGAEFLLKSKITQVSPFLLLDGSPSGWPRGSDRTDTAFSDFRTIDAQDLIRAHDTVAPTRLPEDFKRQFDDLRRRRNTIMHSLDHSLELTAESVLRAALSIVHTLTESADWLAHRRSYLEVAPTAAAYSSNHVEPVVIAEVQILLRILDPSEALEIFTFDMKCRSYLCPTCRQRYEWDDIEPMTAVLRPNSSTSTEVHCFVCEETHPIVREDCPDEECPGNVLSEDAGICLTCMQELERFGEGGLAS